MKNSFWILFSIFIPSTKTFTEFNSYNNDGWRPIIPNYFKQYQERIDTTTTQISNPNQKVEETLPKVEVIEFLVPKNDITEDKSSSEAINVEFQATDRNIQCTRETRCNINKAVVDPDHDQYGIDLSNEVIKQLVKTDRKGKEISEFFGNKLANEHNLISYTTDEIEISEENESRKSSSNIYEVTERIPSIPQTIKDVNENTEEIGYFYEPPKIDKTNLTNNFISILSKYNIMVNDKLPNYALSRRNKGHNRLPTRLMHYPNDLRIPYGYNSLNHLLVDPILAVFLSNYGYYLPGLYGFNRNYNNLYGYLASNNIHNNKPFGLYKIYADTDSSQ